MQKKNPTINKAIHKLHHRLVNQKLIDNRAISIIGTLHNAGYQAYLVGGAIRDILCGIEPKDFDIVTDARPLEVKNLFRNSRIIGRRFKIIHIFFNRYVIEVSTLRKAKKPFIERLIKSKYNKGDNNYGKSLFEDCARRDLTVNSLAYNPFNDTVYDFFDGYNDLIHKRIKLIGDPTTRFIEDPVRILRVIRFSSKLNFKINSGLSKDIHSNSYLLAKINSSRVFEEFTKLFVSEHALENLYLLKRYKIHKTFFPSIAKWMDNTSSWQYKIISLALENTAKRLKNDKPVTPSFLFAVFLWPLIARKLFSNNFSYLLFNKNVEKILNEQSNTVSLNMKDKKNIKSIWLFQINIDTLLESEKKLLDYPLWRAGYNLYMLRYNVHDENTNKNTLGELTKYYEKYSYKK